MDLQRLIETTHLSGGTIETQTRRIYDRLLRDSSHLEIGNFRRLHRADLEAMFNLYDQLFLCGRCKQRLGDVPLHFRISQRMTRSGANTVRRARRDRAGTPSDEDYTISVSGPLLFQSFQQPHRPVVVCGLFCSNRLEALQRLFEHELVHLVEMLVWSKSTCSGARFQSIASRLFGHTEHRHRLITPQERAAMHYGIGPGDRVCFPIDGNSLLGIVNRITKRATVLVEDPRGRRYSDGRRYSKFYVPLELLQKQPAAD